MARTAQLVLGWRGSLAPCAPVCAGVIGVLRVAPHSRARLHRFPPAQTKAVCTLENNPRQPSDCAIYVFMKIDDDEV